MRIITGLLFIINLIAWIAFDVFCWIHTGGTLGWVVLIGIVAFLISWGLSGEAVVAPLDYFLQPEWDIFVIKIKWANSISLITMFIFVMLCIMLDWLGLREFLNLNIQ